MSDDVPFHSESIPRDYFRAILNLYRTARLGCSDDDRSRLRRMLNNETNRRGGIFQRVHLPGLPSRQERYRWRGRTEHVPHKSPCVTRTVPNHLGWPCRRWEDDWQRAIVLDRRELEDRVVRRVRVYQWRTDVMRRRFSDRLSRYDD